MDRGSRLAAKEPFGLGWQLAELLTDVACAFMSDNNRGLSNYTASSLPAFRIKDEPTELPIEEVVRVTEQNSLSACEVAGNPSRGVWGVCGRF